MPSKQFRIPEEEQCEHYSDPMIGVIYLGKNEDGKSKLECPVCHKVMLAESGPIVDE